MLSDLGSNEDSNLPNVRRASLTESQCSSDLRASSLSSEESDPERDIEKALLTYFPYDDSDLQLDVEKGILHPSKSLSLREDPKCLASPQNKLLNLAGYFALGLSLAVYNKAILGEFAYPWLLTTIQATCFCIGSTILCFCGVFQMTKLTTGGNLALAAYSTLFTFSVAISNVSPKLMSLSFNQLIRSAIPLTTLILYRIVLRQTFNTRTALSLIPITLGATLATSEPYHTTCFGVALSLLGVVVTATESITTHRLMAGQLNLSPLELILRMSPLVVLQSVVHACVTGECTAVAFELDTHRDGSVLSAGFLLLLLVGNGVLAFGFYVVSLRVNRSAGPLTLAVAGNGRQTVTILLEALAWSAAVGPWMGVGTVVTVVGIAWYGREELLRAVRLHDARYD